MTRRELIDSQKRPAKQGRAGPARWDIYAIKADFDLWIDSKDGRDPRDYQAAFYGFARQFHKREGR
jgi:hypothetical protein